MSTVARLHKLLGALIDQGHGRKPVLVNKETFYDPREDDGCVLLKIFGVEGPRWICTADDDGGVKVNKDGTEAGSQVVVLYGCLHEPKSSEADGKGIAP